MTNKRLNARMFPDLYTNLGIDTGELGCIMLDVEPLDVVKFVPGGEEDLHFSPTLKYGQGAVAEKSAHITLLYGLMEYGPTWQDHVDLVLNDWNRPDTLEIESIGYFPGSVAGEDYSVIVGHIRVSDELLEGHQRLQFLPHIDTFPGYAPHVTLAYVKGGYHTRYKWIAALEDEYTNKALTVTNLNYGDSSE